MVYSINFEEKLISAYYYVNNYYEPANVTNKIISLYSMFKLNKEVNTFIVSNELFGDTILYSVKTLYINIGNGNGNKNVKTLEFIEGSIFSWDEFIEGPIFMLNDFEDTLSTLIDVSFGEIMDKYSILEIKHKYISTHTDLIEVTKELSLFNIYRYNEIKRTFAFFYKLLLHINEQIWLDNDKIKQIDIGNRDPDNILNFALTSSNIFINNQKRFRLRNYFNKFIYSGLREHKGYIKTSCYIDISDENTIHNKIPEINYLFLEYDHLYFNLEYLKIIRNIFKNPNMSFIEDETSLGTNITIKLIEYTFDNQFRHIYEF